MVIPVLGMSKGLGIGARDRCGVAFWGVLNAMFLINLQPCFSLRLRTFFSRIWSGRTEIVMARLEPHSCLWENL